MIDFERAKLDPADYFSGPEDVLNCQDFTVKQKIEILNQWRYDVCELQVAEEENMASNNDSGNLLQRILAVLHQLGATVDSDHISPTKQGGDYTGE